MNAGEQCAAWEGPRAGAELLAGQNIVYLGPEPWDGMWRNRHQLMSRFARTNQVLYVEPPVRMRALRRGLGDGRVRWSDVWRQAGRPLVVRKAENVTVYRPPMYIPIAGRGRLRDLMRSAWLARLRGILRELHFIDPIVWFSRPNMAPYLGHLGEKLAIYHVVDEYSGYLGVKDQDRARILEAESVLLSRVDLVVAVSKPLFDSKRRANPNCYLVPNGVDSESYANARARAQRGALPADLADVCTPIVGYSGLMNARLDYTLLYRCAREHPEWTFAFMGRVDERSCGDQVRRLSALPNVRFLGEKTIQDLPLYVAACAACLMPYRDNLETQNISPLKLYDYLAAGRPVVSTNIPAVDGFEAIVRIARTDDEFVAHLEGAVAERERGLDAQRQRIARDNDWNARIADLSRIIGSHLCRKSPASDTHL